MKASERHKLKHDKYADTVMASWTWVTKHRQLIIVGLAALLIFAIAILIMVTSRSRAEAKSERLLVEIRQWAMWAVNRADDSGSNPDLVKLIDTCEELAKEYPRSAALPWALIQTGKTLTQCGNPVEATDYFRRAMDVSENTQSMARRGLAEALEAAGKLEEAIQEYDVFTKSTDAAEVAQADWDIGRCYASLGNEEKAAEYYREATDKGRNLPWAEYAHFELLKLLENAPQAGELPPPTTPANETMGTPEIKMDIVPPAEGSAPKTIMIPLATPPERTAEEENAAPQEPPATDNAGREG